MAQEAHRHLHSCQDAVPAAEHALREAQQRALECAAAEEAARADHDDACMQATYHDSLSHLMKQAADSALDTLRHERTALVRLPCFTKSPHTSPAAMCMHFQYIAGPI